MPVFETGWQKAMGTARWAWLVVPLCNRHGQRIFTLGHCNTFTAHFTATGDKGDNHPAFQKVLCCYLLTEHSAVKLAQPHRLYKYQVLFLASSTTNLHLPLVIQALCRSTKPKNQLAAMRILYVLFAVVLLLFQASSGEKQT